MISEGLLEEYRRALTAVVEETRGHLAAAYSQLNAGGMTAKQVQLGMLQAADEITPMMGTLSSAAAADFYEAQRVAALGEGYAQVEIAGAISYETLEKVTYETGRLLQDREVKVRSGARIYHADPEAFFREYSTRIEKLVLDQARETIVVAGVSDPVRPKWRRVAQPDACDYCANAAAEGWSWPHRNPADIRTFHDHCRCITVADWIDGAPDFEAIEPSWDVF